MPLSKIDSDSLTAPLTVPAGSAAAPAITTTGDTNTGIFFPAADTIAFAEGGAEAMRIDSAGFVGVGTTTPTVKFEAVAGTGGLGIGLFRTGDATAANNAGGGFNATSSATAGSRLAQVWLDADGANFGGGDYFYINKIGNSGNVELIQQSNAAMTFQTNGAERARIDSSGIVLVGATSARTTQAKLELRSAANTALSLYMFKDTQVEATLGFKSSTDSNFYVGSGSTSVGTNGVYLANAGTSWVSNSDERLKENLVPIADAISKVSALRSVIGNFIADKNKTPRPFLIAQDVQQVLPEAIGKSEIDGTEYLGVSYTEVIPLLVAAIKEQQALIVAQQAELTALTTRITALEAA